MSDAIFHRNFSATYPIAVSGSGSVITDADGNDYLDAASGAVAANLGHGVREIADAMHAQALAIGFAHTLRFETDALARASELVAALAGNPLNTVYFASSGAEANEAAFKLARQIHLDGGAPGKHLVVGRWQNYHGNTLATLAAGGDMGRRSTYTPMLPPTAHVPTPDCAHCPLGRTFDDCAQQTQLPCVSVIEHEIKVLGPENVAAFICEPIVGSQQGALVPPAEYLLQVRELCDRYNIVLIVDEVMTGFGRTGEHFAFQAFDITPDIVTFGKGVTGGYAPLSGMIVHDRLIDIVRTQSNGVFRHGSTYSGHPVSVAAGQAALTYYREHRVLDNVRARSAELQSALTELADAHPGIADVRGRGLLMAFDLADAPEFPALTSEEFNARTQANGAIFYPGRGRFGGFVGQHLLIAPPLTATADEIARIVEILDTTLTECGR
jgi:adenosylmethionine-8-amino-7-oxononanoate aminotransferase